MYDLYVQCMLCGHVVVSVQVLAPRPGAHPLCVLQGVPVAVVSSASCEFPLMEGAGDSSSPQEKGGDSSGDQDSGISLQIPSWKGPLMVSIGKKIMIILEIF